MRNVCTSYRSQTPLFFFVYAFLDDKTFLLFKLETLFIFSIDVSFLVWMWKRKKNIAINITIHFSWMRIMAAVVVAAMSRIKTRIQRQTLKLNGKAQLFPTKNTFCNHCKKRKRNSILTYPSAERAVLTTMVLSLKLLAFCYFLKQFTNLICSRTKMLKFSY